MFETEDGKSLSSINRRYRATKSDMRALANKLGLLVPESRPPHLADESAFNYAVMEANAIRWAQRIAQSDSLSV